MTERMLADAGIGTGMRVLDVGCGRGDVSFMVARLVGTEAIRQLTRALRPGGLVVFQEADSTMVPASLTPLALHERAHAWMWRTVEREGANIHMGFALASVFERAGLTGVQVRAEALVQTPTISHITGAIVRAMLPRIVKHGIATEAEIDVDTLDQRLAAERRAANATYVGDMVFGAWGRMTLSSSEMTHPQPA
jgi:hypothetical protein